MMKLRIRINDWPEISKTSSRCLIVAFGKGEFNSRLDMARWAHWRVLVPPSGAHVFFLAYPALTRWANLSAPPELEIGSRNFRLQSATGRDAVRVRILTTGPATFQLYCSRQFRLPAGYVALERIED